MELSDSGDEVTLGHTGKQLPCNRTVLFKCIPAKRLVKRSPVTGKELVKKWKEANLFPWLRVAHGRVMCKCCPHFGMPLEQLHKGHMQRHGNSWMHKYRSSGGEGVIVPSEEEFDTVWKELAKGKPPHHGIEGIAKSGGKIRHFRSCLAEGIRCGHRKFLKNAGISIGLLRDDSKARMQITFKCTNCDLRTMRGLLAWVRTIVTDAVTKTGETAEAIKLFATPRTGYLQLGDVDDSLLQNILKSVRYMATDAASSEVLSVRLMREGIGGQPPLVPNLQCHTRDKAHATRRVLTRPFAADAYCNELVKRFLMNEDTLISTINYSSELADFFRASCRKRGLNTRT